MARKRKSKKVESLKHRDKRKNIPTEELREFVGEDEEAPPGRLYTVAAATLQYTQLHQPCCTDTMRFAPTRLRQNGGSAVLHNERLSEP